MQIETCINEKKNQGVWGVQRLTNCNEENVKNGTKHCHIQSQVHKTLGPKFKEDCNKLLTQALAN
jgi:hypothetical protein